MSRKWIRAVAPVATIAATLPQGSVQARETDAEFRVEVGAQGNLGAGAELRVAAEQRFRDADDVLVLTAAVDVAAVTVDFGAGSVELGGGAQVQDIDGRTELRPYQQVIVTAGSFSFRTRLEERFFEGADQMALRLRQRVQYAHPLSAATRAIVNAELLYQLRDRVSGGPRRVDRWGLAARIQHRLAPHVQLSATHTLEIRPRPAGQTRHTHVSQFSLAYLF